MKTKQEIVEKFKAAIDKLHTPETAETILQFIQNKEYCKKPLKFKKWFGHTIVAVDAAGFTYYIIGSFWTGRYVLRGVVRSRTKTTRRCAYLPNGQASRGTIQIAHIGELDEVEFPEIIEAYQDQATLY